MGRGGGHSGGGGFSSGGSRGFSSHRSSSSHRSGGSSLGSRRSSSSRSSSSLSHSSHSTPRPRPPAPPRIPVPPLYTHTTIYTGPGPRVRSEERPERRQEYHKAPKKESRGIPGWYTWLCSFAAVIIMIMMGFCVITMDEARNYHPREKLGSEAAISSSYVIGDELGWISNSRTVTEGMDYFYEKTGVRPYLLICDNLDGRSDEITDEQAEASLKALYDTMFHDEGHMIFTFMEYAESEYITYLYTGTAADSVMDQEARELFLNNVDRLYTDSSLSDEAFFSKVFRVSADKIMKDASGAASIARFCVISSILIASGMVFGFICFKIAEEKRKELEQVNQLLSTPIPETEKSAEDEALLEKYLKDEGE